MTSPMSGIAPMIFVGGLDLGDVERPRRPRSWSRDGLKMILGMTLAIGSRRLQMFSVLPPLALMLAYVSPPPATASAAASAAVSASRPIDSKLRKVASPTSSIGLREPRPRRRDGDVGGQREDGQADGEDAGDQRGEQHLVLRGDLVRVGVGGEVLAPAAAVDVGAEAAEQQPRAVRAIGEVQRDVDRVRVPERDAEHGEDLRQQASDLQYFVSGHVAFGLADRFASFAPMYWT